MRHVDLLLYARDSFRLPTTSFKLKEVAGYFGFQWRHPDLRSIFLPLYYREYVRTPKKNREARSNTGTQLLEYNQDDLEATLCVWSALQSIGRGGKQ
jgi:predicted RecB family nuclease